MFVLDTDKRVIDRCAPTGHSTRPDSERHGIGTVRHAEIPDVRRPPPGTASDDRTSETEETGVETVLEGGVNVTRLQEKGAPTSARSERESH